MGTSDFTKSALPFLAIAEAIGTRGKSPGTIAMGQQQIIANEEERKRRAQMEARQAAMQARLMGLRESEFQQKGLDREATRNALTRQLEQEQKAKELIAQGSTPAQAFSQIKPLRSGELEKEVELFQSKQGILGAAKESAQQKAFENQLLLQNRKFENELEKERIKAENAAKKKSNKPPSQTMFKATLFGRRMQQAEKEIKDLLDSGFDPASITGTLSRKTTIGEEGRRWEQARRNWINATLRRESGAVINQQEFANAEAQYFPTVFDTPAILEQKERNRKLATAIFKAEAGKAWDMIPDLTDLTKIEKFMITPSEDGQELGNEFEVVQ